MSFNAMELDSHVRNSALTGRERRLRLGIIGCGAIAEGAHLPAALTSPRAELTVLTDTSEPRLRHLQSEFGLGPITRLDYRDTFDLVDAVILALPNNLHAPVAIEFLSRGIHVLCEKPLASTLEECERMCRAADAGHAVLAVGYVTRFFPSTELTKGLIHSGFLGSLQSFDYEFGTAGGWVTSSGYNLSRATSGGGVLMVSGSHFIDRMLYIFGRAELIDYRDDSHGGVEANCFARFQAEVLGQAVPGQVILSKTHRLANRLRVIGDTGTLEVREGQARSVHFSPAHGKFQEEIFPAGMSAAEEPDYFSVQLDDFLRAIQTHSLPRIDGAQGTLSVALMEQCYRIASRLDEPWNTSTLDRLRAAMPQVCEENTVLVQERSN